VIWQKKEMEEQQFVTDFILNNLKNLTSEVAISSPYSLKAGALLHIKTDIEGILNDNSNLKQVISVLHPTPLFVDYLNRKQKILFWKTRGTTGNITLVFGRIK
jgi:isochorismate synthase